MKQRYSPVQSSVAELRTTQNQRLSILMVTARTWTVIGVFPHDMAIK